MQHRLPERVDPHALVRGERTLAGAVPVAALERLRPLLAAHGGELEVELHFGRDDSGRALVTGHVAGAITLTCERCLGGLQRTLDLHLRLGLVDSEARVADVPAGSEPLVVAQGSRIAPVDLVEDEILLSLPMFPMHAEPCSALGEGRQAPGAQEQDRQRENPFAVLAQLKSHQEQE